MEKYDPSMDFWKRAIEFLFRQAPAIVFLGVAVSFLWLKMADMERQSRIDRIEIRRECADSITEIRNDLRMCRDENDQLRQENRHLLTRVTALEARIKTR